MSPVFHACLLAFAAAVFPAGAAIYEVGPQSALQTIGEAPWSSLHAGDQVLIHWRPEPYREKWVISTSGQPDAPITIRGVPGPDGQLPVIDGRDAASIERYFNEDRAIIKIGDGATASELAPSHLVVENLEITGAIPPFTFRSSHGVIPYLSYAAALWIQRGSDIVIRHCALHNSANGLITSHETTRILVEKCHIYNNGIEKSTQQHNIYTESAGIVFQFNRVGPLRAGALGNTLKDRSSDTVIRYNWLEGGSRVLDLVDSDYETLRQMPSYKTTYVYGNVMIKDDTGANNQIVHYGGDSGQEDHYRRGALNFYHNTIVVYRQPRTILFQLSSADDSVLAVDNIFSVDAAGSRLIPLGGPGALTLDHNLFSPGWKTTFEKAPESGVKYAENLENRDPGFANFSQRDFHPTSDAASNGKPLSVELASAHPIRFEYREPLDSSARSTANPPEIGALSRLR